MRTNIDIDSNLLKEVMDISGIKTKKAMVEHSLRKYLSLKKQEKIKQYRGKLRWEGDLDAMRRD